MNIKIEIAEKIITENNIQLIVECNGYEDDKRIIQFSRSPFTYSLIMTDEDIINDIAQTEYKIYL